MRQYLDQLAELPGSVKYFLMTEVFVGLGIGMWSLSLNFLLASKGMAAPEIGEVIAVSPLASA